MTIFSHFWFVVGLLASYSRGADSMQLINGTVFNQHPAKGWEEYWQVRAQIDAPTAEYIYEGWHKYGVSR